MKRSWPQRDQPKIPNKQQRRAVMCSICQGFIYDFLLVEPYEGDTWAKLIHHKNQVKHAKLLSELLCGEILKLSRREDDVLESILIDHGILKKTWYYTDWFNQFFFHLLRFVEEIHLEHQRLQPPSHTGAAPGLTTYATFMKLTRQPLRPFHREKTEEEKEFDALYN
jgi:hypothetical protein